MYNSSRKYPGEVATVESQFRKERDYWTNKLSGELVKAGFPYNSKKLIENNPVEAAAFSLAGELFSRLLKISGGSDARLHIILAAGLNLLLGKYTGLQDIVIGSPIYRQDAEGQLVNSVLALRNHINDNMTFKELLMQVNQTLLEATENQNYPIEALLYQLNMSSVEGEEFPLFDIVVLLENIHEKKYIRHINPNMVFSFLKTGECIEGTLEYNASKYDKTNIAGIIACFIHVLEEAIFNVNEEISNIEMVPGAERKKLLYDFNNTAAGYPGDKTIHELFAARVEKTPHQSAAVFQHQALTYMELNSRANQLAELIRCKGMKSEYIVGLLVDRSLEVIIGIIAVIKSGCAYLPLDPRYPAQRLSYMLTDSSASMLLTTGSAAAAVEFKGEIIDIENKQEYQGNTKNPRDLNKPGDILYIIYTSGTTSHPKGVMVEHRNLVRLLFNDAFQFDFRYTDVWTMFHSPCFDFSVWEMYGALLLGGKLMVVPRIVAMDTLRFLRLLEKQAVTVLNQTPSAFYPLMHEVLKRKKRKLSLRYVIFGGEALNTAKLKEWKETFPRVKVANMFGITETTVHVTYKEITAEDTRQDSGNIGKPLPTLSLYVMDRHLKLLPVGVPGELCVGGAGVARGYLNKVELTGEKFRENPYKTRERLYRSGDLGSWSENGESLYMGRIDRQVQLRGFRIELGEIETRLLQHEDISEAVVIDRDDGDGDKYLCAYIISGKELEPSELRSKLAETLPDYMIPSFFVQVQHIPLTPNGKVDPDKLPEPKTSGKSIKGTIPTGEMEKKMTALWADVLGIKRDDIVLESNFFQLGGHSLKASILTSKLHKELDVEIPLKEIFTRPTIKELSKYIAASRKKSHTSIKVAEKQEYYPLSSAQKRMFVLYQMDVESTGYNMPFVVTLEGKPDREKLAETFRKLIARHESLRTSFKLKELLPVQVVHQKVDFEIEHHCAERTTDSAQPGDEPQAPGAGSFAGIIKNFTRPFDLSRPPLLRLGLIAAEPQKYFMLLDMHHIISDGISMEILVHELVDLYAGRELPWLRVQYKDYCRWQNHELQQRKEKQQVFWQKQFEGEIPVLNLPTDFPRPAVQSFEGRRFTFEITPGHTASLKNLALEQGATLFMVLLAAISVLLSKLSSQEDIVVGSPVAGRSHVDLETIIGMFVNTLALKNNAARQKTFYDFLKEVKDNTLAALENQDYPFEELVELVEINRDFSRNPIFDVMFLLRDTDTNVGITGMEVRAGSSIQGGGLTIKPHVFESNTSKFDLWIEAVEIDEKLAVTCGYCTKLFKESTVKRFTRYFEKIIAGITEDNRKQLCQIDIISRQEKQEILNDFNHTAVPYPKDKTIHTLFEEQVKKNPDHTALIGQIPNPGSQTPDNRSITYRELNEKSNHLAHLLRKKGVKPDMIVGLRVERSIKLIISLLGILKAGGAYLPIDPGYPGDRVNYLLQDSGVRLLVKEGDIPGDWPVVEWIDSTPVDDPDGFSFSAGIHPHRLPASAASLAYVIYTSGSTGKPKGVLIQHQNVVRLVKNSNLIDFTLDDKLLLTGAVVFDITTYEIWWPLLNGVRLYLTGMDVILDAERLEAFLAARGITILHLIPQLFNQLVSQRPGMFGRLSCLLVGGDMVNPEYVNRVRDTGKGPKVLHMYGPTENTTFSTSLLVDRDYKTQIPIGKPIANSTAYIQDRYGKLQPVGVVGELCTGGDGVARGYLNNPELTAQKFEHDGYYSSNSSHRSYRSYRSYIYHTGDLACWLPDGNIQFFGRKDHQVKIRGVRIELGEIENALRRHKDIEECIAAARKVNENMQLVLYYKEKNKIRLWPSLAEYYVYDDLIYNSMVRDQSRNEVYRKAIKKVVKDKVILEIGPGSEAILSRICIEAGAKKVYAVEILTEAYEKAVETVKKLNLQDKIILIHGDVTSISLPGKVDYCVSEIVGTIGGSEGAAKIINSARKLLKNPTCMIPSKSITYIGAVTLPEEEFAYAFDELGVKYVNKIFAQVGYPFDLRLSLLSFARKNIISIPGIFEELDFTGENPLESQHEIHLSITANSIINGFILWLDLYCDHEEVIETLEKKYIWLPVYFPVFPAGQTVQKGDYIKAKVTRTLSSNNLNPDFTLAGTLYKKHQEESIDFTYHSFHLNTTFKGNDFYKRIFSADQLKVTEPLTSGQLREFLSHRLPDYMIPSYFVKLEEIPLNPNGKIDRKALPPVEPRWVEEDALPTNALEKMLLAIWAEVLGLDKKAIGIHADFFEVGGHSLSATLLVSRIHKALNIRIPLAELFRNGTISGLARYIAGLSEEEYKTIEISEKKEYYQLSSAQKRVYIELQVEHDSTSYNMRALFRMEGPVVVEKLEAVFQDLVRRHESFRTSFALVNYQPVQKIHQPEEIDFIVRYFNAETVGKVETIIRDFVRPFDISRAPLLRVGLIKIARQDHILVADMSHIIADGMSMAILAEDFVGLYNGETLSPLGLTYKDFSQWHNRLLAPGRIERQEAYWLDRFNDRVPVLDLPLDFPRPKVWSGEGRSISFEIDRQMTAAVKQFMADTETTLYIVLLTAYNILLTIYTGQDDIVIGSPVAGRTHVELEKIIGIFVNMLAMRNHPGGDKTVREFLAEVKKNALDAYANQEYQLENLVWKLDRKAGSGRNPLFDVVLAVENMAIREIEIESLKVTPYADSEIAMNQYDLLLRAEEANDTIVMKLEYSTALFKPSTAQQISGHYIEVLEQVLDNPDMKLQEIILAHHLLAAQSNTFDEDGSDFRL